MISQVIKENKIRVHAKREEKTTERLLKSKFNKEYELSEKINTYSLTGGLTCEGRLVIAADVKSHTASSSSKTGRFDDNMTNNDQPHTVTVMDTDKSTCDRDDVDQQPVAVTDR